MGEVSNGSLDGIDVEAIARQTNREIGYNDHRFGFDADSVAAKIAHRCEIQIAYAIGVTVLRNSVAKMN